MFILLLLPAAVDCSPVVRSYSVLDSEYLSCLSQSLSGFIPVIEADEKVAFLK